MQLSILVGICALVFSIAYYILVVLKPGKKHDDDETENQDADDQDPQIVGGNRLQRLRRRNQMAAQNNQELIEQDDVDRQPGAPPKTELELLELQMQTVTDKKEYKKLEKRQQKLQQKEQLKQYQDQQLQLKEEREAKTAQAEEERDRIRMEQEEEERKQELEKKLKEQKEFEDWAGQMTIEAEGEQTMDDDQSISDFVNYIKKRKVVMLEDIAAQFSLATKDVVLRIEQVEKIGRLTGITDDRGKYIYIAENEFEAVAKYVSAKGRVSRTDLLQECNKLIRMEPTAQDKREIEEEQKALVSQVKATLNQQDD